MRNRLSALGVILVGGSASLSGCSSSPQGCTNIGCSDGFTANVMSPAGTFPSGTHRIEILADAATLMCMFTLPLPKGQGTVSQCQSGLTVNVLASTETITVAGTPAQVHVWQYVDDLAVLDAAAVPSYSDHAPNGPECGPVCRQASATWTLQ